MKKTLLIDARMITDIGHGIAQYVEDLAHSMAGHWGDWEPLYLVAANCPPQHPIRKYPHQVSAIPFLAKLEPWQLAKEIRKIQPDAFLSPSFSSLWRYPCPHYVICHDLNHLQFGSFPQRQYYRWLLFPALNTARAVATVSDTAKKELEHWMELEGRPKTFAVIPNVVQPIPIGKNPTALENFFFCLSNSKPHKNVEWLRLQHRQAFAQGALPMIANVGGDQKEWRVVKPSRAEIGALYASAKAFFFPSLYEGFGRPPVEAALLGTLPVVSDIPVHREALAGVKEAIFLPLHDEQLWVKTMVELSQKPRITVSAESRQWVLEKYSPEAQRTAFLQFWQNPTA